MNILVLNAGSSSIKFQLFDLKKNEVIAGGLVESIGESTGGISYKCFENGSVSFELKEKKPIKNHNTGLKQIADLLLDSENGVIKDASQIEVVGHRVVHGAELFSKPVLVNKEILKQLKEVSFLAPLHNPANIEGIEIASEVFPKASQVAVFDTAFHQTIPEHAFRFPIPNELYEKNRLRVYGFHGTSHAFVSKKAADYLNIPIDTFNAITVHLGNGCSMAAIKNGKSVDVSMGLTPLSGLMMGTRSGDVDPSLPLFMSENLGMKTSDIDRMLNKESGLKGIAGDNDLRKVLERVDAGDVQAKLAVEMYVYRIKKYIGAYLAVLGSCHCVIFTAGVGENSALIRKLTIENMENLGIQLDEDKNKTSAGVSVISTDSSQTKVMVVPTNEELEIATQAYELINS